MQEIKDLQVSVLAISYYLYRQAKTPYGDNVTGLAVWLDMQKAALEKMLGTVEDD